MKKHKGLIVSLICGLLFMIIGAAFVGIGLTNNGSNHLEIYEKTYIDGLFSGIGIRTSEGKKEKIYTAHSEINSLEVNCDESNIVFKKSNKFKLQVTSNKSSEVKVKEGNGKYELTISNESFVLDQSDPSKIICYVPESVKDISLSTNAGDIELSDVKCDKLKLNCDVGDIFINNANIIDGTIESNVGDIEFYGDFINKLDVSSNTGDIEVELSRRKQNYNYECSSDVGDVDTDDEHKTHHSANASANLTCTTNIGDIDLSFND